MKTIRWGLIGCAKVAETKSGPRFCRAANSQLVVIRAPDIDAVCVATMTESGQGGCT